jgi:hypothetical protein
MDIKIMKQASEHDALQYVLQKREKGMRKSKMKKKQKRNSVRCCFNKERRQKKSALSPCMCTGRTSKGDDGKNSFTQVLAVATVLFRRRLLRTRMMMMTMTMRTRMKMRMKTMRMRMRMRS